MFTTLRVLTTPTSPTPAPLPFRPASSADSPTASTPPVISKATPQQDPLAAWPLQVLPQPDGGVEIQFAYMDGRTAWATIAAQSWPLVDLALVASAARVRPPKLGRRQ